jgi:cystathionine beta-synthase
MQYAKSILELIGNTPLVKLNHVASSCECTILAKLESQNPGGSVKDRIGIAMIEDAERNGSLQPGGTIVEPTSGNTGVGIALAARIKGYRCIFVMTDKASQERVKIVKAMGAEVMIVPSAVGPDSPDYYTNAAKRLVKELPNAVMFNQFENPSNPEAHYHSTGPEIWDATDGTVTHFIAGMGTGGTISGVGKYLKEKNPSVKIIGADPDGSVIKPYKDTGRLPSSKPYLVEGVGQECIPGALDIRLVDEVVNVTDKESFAMARRLAREEGIFCGGSSGMNVAAAVKVGRLLPKDSVIVAIICDTGERYLTKHHSDEWLQENKLLDMEYIPLKMLIDDKRLYSKIPLLVSVEPQNTIKEALEQMQQYELSELPVLEEGAVVGRIRESKLMARLLEDRNIFDVAVRDFMEDPMPVVDSHTDVQEGIALLRENANILVSDFGRILGVISRHDALGYA